MVAHVPHASTVIPPDIRARLLPDDDALAAELVRMTDWHTDALFAFTGDLGAIRLVNGRSRLVVDPERFADDTLEPMAAVGQGAVYTRLSSGGVLREPGAADREALLAAFFHPYHGALDALVAGAVERHERCLVLDCHSFATIPLPTEPDQSPGRPDICIGTDAFHTPPSLASALVMLLREEGFEVAVDRPFTGAMVPLPAYGRDRRVAAVMVEVRRGLYCDEATGGRLPAFRDVGDRIARGISRALVAEGWATAAT
jgi:N-formylglutamate amidohydrolase